MSFFNWFSGHSRSARATPPDGATRALKRHEPTSAVPFQRPQAEASGSADERKAKRHARREQLYVAIRETMTRAGVLSASYKFKVLSLDQGGNEFLVMMDLVKASAAPTPRLGEIEALMVQDARQRFVITVHAVYWRVLD